MSDLKYNSERGLRYIEMHRKIVEDKYLFSDYYYNAEGDKCECGKENITHCFVLRNPEGKEIVLGSTCIVRNENYKAIFDGNPMKWKKLQDELKQYAELFKMIKDSPEYKTRRVYLAELEQMKKERIRKYNESLDDKKKKTDALVNTLKAYYWKTNIYFLKSLIDQAEISHTLSDRQIEVANKIIDEYNQKNNVTIEMIVKEYSECLSLPTYAEDFRVLSRYLKLGMYDRDKVEALSRIDRFNDWEVMRADKIMVKYRKQLRDIYKIMLDSTKSEAYPERDRMVYMDAYDRVVEVIPEMKNE